VNVIKRMMELPRRRQDSLRQAISILKQPQNKATTSPSQQTATLAGDNITVERHMGLTETSEASGRTPSSPAIVRQDSLTPESPGEEVDYDED
jgi:hypothetical protein